MISLSLDHRVAAGQQFNLLQISLVVGVWFPGPRIHISGSHRPAPSGDLGPSPCPLWSFRGPAAARTRAPPSTLPLSVGRHHYNYSNVWFTNYKTEKCVWCALGDDYMGPKKAQKTASWCSSVQVSSSAWRQMEYSVKYESHLDVKWAADHAT